MELGSVNRVQADSRVVAATGQDAQADLLLTRVRQTIWAAFILAIANGVFLYFLPWLAETDYAWSIRPPVSAAFMGAGYLSGVLASGLALFVARYWRSVWGLMWPFFTIGLVELLATILHADRFRWDYWLTWVWTAVYVAIPPSVVVLWVLQQRVSPKRPSLDARLMPLRTVSGVLGAIVCVFGVLLFLTPETFIPNWPWQITPLLARAFSAWYLQMGVTLVFSAATLRQPHEALIPYSWLAAVNALFLLLPVLYAGSMSFDSAGFWLWLLLHGALLAVGLWATLQSYTRMKAAGQRL